ncbi:MAG: nuclear transport factor 2 family protein [Acidobacteriia bacterium]|nr:nuclear transport factor 2 family protein [Terriglobia bacterium]
MRKIFIIMLLLVVSASLTAQPPGVHADASPTAESEIKALELKLAGMIIRGDWDEYAMYLAPDYLHTRYNGQVESKDEALASLRDVKRKIIVMEMEPADLAIRIYGDTALANAEFTITVRDSGQVKSRRTRLTDVFLKRDGQWCLVAGQETPIGK